MYPSLDLYETFYQSNNFSFKTVHVILIYLHVFFNEFIKIRDVENNLVNSHMHEMGPQRPKHHIFDYLFYLKNVRKLRFHVFLHFKARKHMIS